MNVLEQEELLQVKREPVKSSQIKSYAPAILDSGNGAVIIEFHNGSIWAYTPINEHKWEQFEMAESKGKFFNGYIKNCLGIQAFKLQDKTKK